MSGQRYLLQFIVWVQESKKCKIKFSKVILKENNFF